MNIPLAKPIVTPEMKEAVLRVLESRSYILGEENEKLEAEFARYCGVKYGVAVNSGTAALHLSLLSLGIAKDDEVITVSHTYIATSNTILLTGAKPVFVDINPETFTIDPEKVKKCITKKTRAIIPVHLYGHPAHMDPILEIANRHDLYVVEDACQAHGALYKGRKVGSLGDVACFSFYPSKNMTVCGDGGILVTDNEDVAEKAMILRNQGQTAKYSHEYLGFNLRLSEIHACIAREQLKHLDEWNKARRKNASAYSSLLINTKKMTKPIEKEWAQHVYHYYVIRFAKRDELMKYLTSRGIGVGIHYPTPVHLQPVYKERLGISEGIFPLTEKIAKEVLSLPCHPTLSYQDINFVADRVNEFVKGKK